MAPTVFLSRLDEGLITAGSVGAIIAMIIICIVVSHITYQVYQQVYKNDGKKVTFISTPKGKRIITLAYIALALYFISCVSMAFVRSNIIVGSSYHPNNNCNIGWILVYHGNSSAKTIIYSIFLYRLYISFKYDTDNAVGKKQLICALVTVWFILIFLIIATATIIAVEDPMINGITPNGYIFCGTPDEWPNLFREAVAIVLIEDIFFNFYILYAFIKRLRHIRKQWTNQLVQESGKTGSWVTDDQSKSGVLPKAPNSPKRMFSGLSRSKSNIDTLKVSKDRRAAKKILKLTRLMMKLTFLVLLAVISSWIAWGLALAYTLASLLYTWDVILNTLCLWLLLSTSDKVWKRFVNVLYYPCCCCYFCPTLRRVDEIDGVTKVIEVNTHREMGSTTTSLHSGKTSDDDPEE